MDYSDELIYRRRMTDSIKLNTKQKEAFDAIIEGKNIFLTAAGGAGKSTLIKYYNKLYGHIKNIAITSTTGTSALLIGGTTLHSYLGIGLGKASADVLVSNILEKSWLKRKWRELEVLIIDEVSMMNPKLFDKLEQVARIIRNSKKPFGGIQLILSGDLLQLGSVDSEEFIFEAISWNKCIEKTIYLTENIRQSEPEFQECLNEIRMGIVGEKSLKLLESRIGIDLNNKMGIKPTKIFPLNYMVDEINKKELDTLSKKDVIVYEYDIEFEFYANEKNREMIIEKYKKNCIATINLQICVNAQVMLLHNLDLAAGLCNGSRGIITKFIEDRPMVKFLNGQERIIDYHVWEYYENDTKIMDVIQIPLKLAYALSAHKCCSENTLIYTSSGLKRISKISSDLITNQKLLSTKEIDIDIIGKTGLQKATQIYKGEVEDTIKITTSLGYTLEGSIRHPLLTYNGEELWKKIPELNINDFLVLKNDLQSFGKNVDTSSFRSNNFNVKYTIPKVVDEKLCYLIGLLIGDGCYSVKTDYPIELTISKEIKEIKDTYLEYFNYIFGKDCKVYTPKNRTTYKLSINSKQVREFLLWCGLNYVIAENKTIPWVVFENTKEAQIGCIKGLFDSDGGVNDRCIHYTTISYQLSVDIQNMLLNIGIISSRQEMNGESRKKYKQAYRVHISGYNAHLFYKYVGFVDKNKQKKLENKYGRYELNVIKTNVCEIPDGNNLIKKLRDEIYSHYKNTMRCNILTSHTSKLFSKIIANKTSLRYFHVKHICEEFKDIDKFGESGKKIKYINDNNLFFDTIKTIENSNCQLYDLYVPKDNTFIGNGIINHNSQGTSLDLAEIDLSEVFCYGQAYIMLSRVKKIEGLSIKKLDIKKITAHPKAVEYYKNLEKDM